MVECGVAGLQPLHERRAASVLEVLLGERLELALGLAEQQQQNVDCPRVGPAPQPLLGGVRADVAEDPSPVGVVAHPGRELQRELAADALRQPDRCQPGRGQRDAHRPPLDPPPRGRDRVGEPR